MRPLTHALLLLPLLLLLLPVLPAAAEEPAPIPGVSTRTVAFPGAAKRNQTLFAHAGKLYAFGGTKSLDPRDFDPKNFCDEGHVIDLVNGKVAALKKPPVPMLRGNTVTAGRFGYAVGGQTHDGTKMVLSDAVWRYNFDKDEWFKLDAKLPSARTLFGVAEHAGVIWVFGGWVSDPTVKGPKGPGLRVTDQIVTIDVTKPTPVVTVRAEKMTTGRRSYPFAVGGGKFFVCGGLDDGFAYVKSAQVYDFVSNKWADFPPPIDARAMAEMVAIGGRLILAGGFSAGPAGAPKPNPFAENKSLEIYDPAGKRWRKSVPALPATVGGSALNLFAHDGMAVVWGIDQGKPSTAYLTTIDPAKLPK